MPSRPNIGKKAPTGTLFPIPTPGDLSTFGWYTYWPMTGPCSSLFATCIIDGLAASCVASGSPLTAASSLPEATGSLRYTTSRRGERLGEPRIVYNYPRTNYLITAASWFMKVSKKTCTSVACASVQAANFWRLAPRMDGSGYEIWSRSLVLALSQNVRYRYGTLLKKSFCTCTKDIDKMFTRSTFRSMDGSSRPVREIRR